MSVPVFWTDEAQETFESIVNFIEYKWGFNSAKKFVNKANKTIASIADHPYIFKAVYPSSHRQAVITGQTSLYEVNSNYIALIFFWDNRQEPMTE